MIRKALPLLVIVAVAAAVGLVSLAAVTAQTNGPTRSLPAAAVPAGDEFEVTISGLNASGFGQVVETLPAGFSYVDDPVTSPGGRCYGRSNRPGCHLHLFGNRRLLHLQGDRGSSHQKVLIIPSPAF